MQEELVILIFYENFFRTVDKCRRQRYNNSRVFVKKKGWLMKMRFTKESVIGDVLDAAPETAKFFLEIGMHCLGCPSARGETIEEACMVHGTNADELVAKINAALEK